MARIDLSTLKAASEGDPSRKVEVSKRWLRAVHDELERLQAIERRKEEALSGSDILNDIFRMGRK